MSTYTIVIFLVATNVLSVYAQNHETSKENDTGVLIDTEIDDICGPDKKPHMNISKEDQLLKCGNYVPAINVTAPRGVPNKIIEMAIFVDHYFARNQRRDKLMVANYVKNVVKAVETKFRYSSMRTVAYFTLKIAHFSILSDWTTEKLMGDRNGGKAYDRFRRWIRDQFKPTQFDLYVLFTGTDFFTFGDKREVEQGVVGLANVPSVCINYGAIIVEAKSYRTVMILAHELCHALGARHDSDKRFPLSKDCNPNTHLMAPYLGPGKTDFSKCTIAMIKETLFPEPSLFKNQVIPNCLNDDTLPVFPGMSIQSVSLPGRTLSLDDQCNFLASSLSLSSQYQKSYCYSFLCTNAIFTVQMGPALDGTKCDAKKYCCNGVCGPGTRCPKARSPYS